MKKLILSLLLLATTQISFAQTWNVGAVDNPNGGETAVVATLDNGTLTVSGIGNMAN